MQLRKLALGVALMVSLMGLHAGCGDDDPGTGGGTGGGDSGTGGGTGGGTAPVNFPEADCTGGAGDGERTYQISEIVLPIGDDLVAGQEPGFDLDGETMQCGIEDLPGSVDNQLAAGLGTALGILPADLNGGIATAIADGELDIELVVKGFDGTANDDSCVTVSLFNDGVAKVTDAQGTVVDGKLYVNLGELSLDIPVETESAMTTASFKIEGSLAGVDVATLTGEVGGSVDVGSSDPYTAETGMGAELGTLYRSVYDIVQAMDSSLHDVVGGIVKPELFDLPATNGNECEAISLGFEIALTEVTPAL